MKTIIKKTNFIVAILVLIFSTVSCKDDENRKYQEQAMQFITENIHIHKSVEAKLINGKGEKENFSPYDYKTLYDAKDALDSLKKQCAVLNEAKQDKQYVSDNFLQAHVAKSINIWKNSPFARHVKLKQFCEYLLPYRAGTEEFSDCRDTLVKKYSFVFDSLIGKTNPVKAAILINNEIKSWLEFDLRSHAEMKDPGIPDIIKQKRGSCRSLTQYTAQAMRSVGIAVSIDECPVWAHRNSGHQWNAVLDTGGNWLPFGGAETNPDEFVSINDSVKAPKIYRHTFSVQNKFQPPVENVQNMPAIFRVSNRIDVTNQYVETTNVDIELANHKKEHGEFLYLAVFNAEKWRIVSWAKIKNGKAIFNNMGNNNIVYLPVYFSNGGIIPASVPFILSSEGKKQIIVNIQQKRDIELQVYNKFYDIIWNIGIPKPVWQMELFYWDNQWVSGGICKIGKNRILKFSDVPKNGLYLIKSHDWGNTWQRIFIIENGFQLWY